MSFNNLDTLYRQVIMDHYQNPRNRGFLENGTLTTEMNNPSCGDRISVQMKVEDSVVTDIKFEGEGCSISMASASMMTQAVKGKPIEEALNMSKTFSQMMLGEKIDPDDFALSDIIALEGVAKFPARIDCATLAWKAMEKGVQDES
ncbi:MAG TPA: SUF system NifU family Fe-S cluster assembly protein [Bacillota bacterium]|nr:SUF system NifU family Fe-S cluster assembly protein [Bacillota bacterium]